MQLLTNLFCMNPSGEYLPRTLDPALREALRTAPVVLVDGPRGVGKTTSALRLAAAQIMLPRDAPLLQVDAAGYLSALPAPVLIDEWQLAGTDLLWTIKEIVDADPTPGRFILTGSVEPAAYGPTYPLTARAVRLVMRPMTQAELRGDGEAPGLLSRLLSGDDPVLGSRPGATFDLSLLTQSGFPGTRSMPDAALFLEAYAALVSQRAGDEGRDASRLLRTMRVLAVLEGQALPDQRIWESADINKVTWKAYEDLLTRAHLAVPSPAFESNRLSRLTAYPKRFLADCALALSLAGLDRRALADPTVAGRYLESFVMQQLRPQVDLAGGVLLHLRSAGGEREIDAVVEVGLDVFAVEVKLGSRPGPADARHLRWLRDELAERFRAGFVVHTGTETYLLDERIWALPVDAVMA